MTASEQRTIVVGGGVIGAFCAWYLHKAGRSVTIVDKGEFGDGCSHGNCGYVSPSHVLPLPGPGQLLYGLKGLLSRNAALRIRPGLSPSLWAWLLKFGSKCNRRDMMVGGKARNTILESARDLYEELIEAERLDVEWKDDGLLFVFCEQAEFDKFGETDQLLRNEFSVSAEPISQGALQEMEPSLKADVAGAWHYRRDSHLRPDRLMSEMKRRLLEEGVTILPMNEMTGFVTSNGRASAIKTVDGPIPADEFVIATGPMTPMLNSELGCRIPVQPGKGYSITMGQPKICPKYPMLLQEAHVGITPFETGYRIGSTMEFSGYNSDLNQERLAYLRSGAQQYLVDPLGEPVEEEWFGWRPMTWDGVPYIDRTPRYSNVWVAAGHNMLGLSMGSATGKLISELVTESKPHIDPHPYRIGRK